MADVLGRGSLRRARRVLRFLSVVLVATLALAACTSTPREPKRHRTHASPGRAAGPDSPNIVFVLTDDLSMNLISAHAARARRCSESGMTMANYDVVDSLCCPSRSAIVHRPVPARQRRVHQHGLGRRIQRLQPATVTRRRSFGAGVAKARATRTGFMGKYLNGYTTRTTSVPVGWDEWDVAGNGYRGVQLLNSTRTVSSTALRPRAEGLPRRRDVAQRRPTSSRTSAVHRATSRSCSSSRRSHRTSPYTPAPRYADAFPKNVNVTRGRRRTTSLPTGASAEVAAPAGGR